MRMFNEFKETIVQKCRKVKMEKSLQTEMAEMKNIVGNMKKVIETLHSRGRAKVKELQDEEELLANVSRWKIL